ncbi:hypothetical protein ACFOLC_10925 [Lysobacter cavernae]|uniref:General secretion pathway protein GspN n=1 Tax=Lysobacter cavernae TaxID=1685901 RepID=A0ABV7RS92_9GAMM
MRLDDAGPRTWLLATLAGWALLAWLLAVAGMGRRTQVLEPDPSLLKPLPQARAVAAARLKPLPQYDQIAARPLFTQDRRPKPFFLPGQSGDESGAAAFDYVLTSVLIAPNLRMAILQPADGSESVRVKLGEVPESHPAWRLTALDARSAVFEGPEGRREMDLRVFDGQGGQPPTALAAPARAGTATSAPIVAPGQPPANAPAPPKPTATRPATGNANAPAAANTPRPATPAETADDAPLTEQAQMEAIRKRIEARRAQLRQQQAAQPPAKTP